MMFSTAGCGQANSYEIFSVRTGLAHFSFEYPARYSMDVVEVRNDFQHQYTHVSLSWLPSGYNMLSVFNLFVSYPDDIYIDANIYLERDPINSYEREPDFKLLGQRTVTVTGVQRREIVSSATVPAELGAELRSEPGTAISRTVYFDSAELIWRLEIGSDKAIQEKTEANFEHIPKTFKVLD
jgi:hypothetical protein